MRGMIPFILYSFISMLSQAQGPVLKWQKCLGGQGDEYPALHGLAIAKDGSYFVSGFADDTIANGDAPKTKGYKDMYILKIDTSGKVLWKKCFGGNYLDYSQAILATKDGGCISVGEAGSTNGDVINTHNSREAWVVKLDSLGNKQWAKCYGGTGIEFATDIKPCADGGYFVIASANSSDFDVPATKGMADIWVFKIDSTGNILWSKTFGGGKHDLPKSIYTTKDGGCIIGGVSASNDGDFPGNKGNNVDDIVVLKLDKNGNLGWNKRFGSIYYDALGAIKQVKDGGYIIAGRADTVGGDVSYSFGSSDCWIIKLDSLGNKIWDKSYGGSLQDEAHDIVQDQDGGYIVSASTYSRDGQVTGQHGSTLEDVWVFKIDSVGKLIWQKTYGGSQQDVGLGMALTQNSEILISGWTNTQNDGDITNFHGWPSDIWVLKLQCTVPNKPIISSNGSGLQSSSPSGNQWYRNGQLISGASGQTYNTMGIGGAYTVTVSNGCGSAASAPLLVTGIVDIAENSSVQIAIHPNPFGESAVVKYSLPASALQAVLKVYDVRGSMVKSFILDVHSTSTSISSEALENGVYFYALLVDGVSFSNNKLVILK